MEQRNYICQKICAIGVTTSYWEQQNIFPIYPRDVFFSYDIYFNDPIVCTAKNLFLLSFEYDTKDKPLLFQWYKIVLREN